MLKLNLGCGSDIREGYINIDSRNLPDCARWDVRHLPYKDADEILANDVYEHISHRESLNLLHHWFTILKPGGVLALRAPCLDVLIQHFLNSRNLDDIEAGIRMLYGDQDYPENHHHTICQSSLIINQLETVGFNQISHYFEAQNIVIRAYKGEENGTV